MARNANYTRQIDGKLFVFHSSYRGDKAEAQKVAKALREGRPAASPCRMWSAEEGRMVPYDGPHYARVVRMDWHDHSYGDLDLNTWAVYVFPREEA